MCDSDPVFRTLYLVIRAHVDLLRVASALCRRDAV
ncbi:putative leader peptide [Streptomyces sp. NBC_01190]